MKKLLKIYCFFFKKHLYRVEHIHSNICWRCGFVSKGGELDNRPLKS